MLPGNQEKKQNEKRTFLRLKEWLTGNGLKCTLAVTLPAVLLFMLFCLACMSARYSLQVGDIAHQTITATKNVEDTVATEQARREAAASVESSYHLVEGASEEVLTKLDAVFHELGYVQQYGQNLRHTEGSQLLSSIRSFSDEEVRYAQTLVNGVTLTSYQTRVLLRTEVESFNTMVTKVRSAVETALNTTIREGQVQKSINSINALCQYEVDKELMDYIVPPVLAACVKANMVVDNEATERAREDARQQVQPTIYKQGQNIIREGERVSASQLAMLDALGLLDTADIDFSIYGGALLLVAISLLMMIQLLKMTQPDVLRNARYLLVVMLVLIITVGLGVVTVKLVNVHLAPVAIGAMLLTALLGPRVGLCAGLSLTLLVSGLAAASGRSFSTEMVNLLMTGLAGTVLSVRYLQGKPQRVQLVICGALVAAVNLLVMLSVGMMTSADLHETIGNAIWAMASGLLSGLIAVGFQPVFEAAFNLATPSKLLELSNPNQPLLRRLQLEAPGTYHHSIVVANLAEAAAERIGANALLARTGAYYHDIGKLKRPIYFKENQGGVNPHDHTNAYVSATIVTAHPREGFQMAQKAHLPPEIQRIIAEHHGDTPVMFFYHKALQQADGKPVDIKDFRYGGNRPSTKESAIVMLADTIEAAVRSMSDPTPQTMQSFIERLMRGKIEDGQLSDSPLSLRDIDGIGKAFIKVLSGVFHERIEYPTVNIHGQNVPTAPAQPAAPAKEAAVPQNQAEAMGAPFKSAMPDGETGEAGVQNARTDVQPKADGEGKTE